MFLLALVFPAPLVATGGRWGGFAGGQTALRRVVKVVTAFTLGHSITLVLGALGWARLPSAVVESATALSILVSACETGQGMASRMRVTPMNAKAPPCPPADVKPGGQRFAVDQALTTAPVA